MIVHTAQLFRIKDPDLLDITVKTGAKPFAPTWDMVWGIKRGTMTREDYEYLYNGILKMSEDLYPQAWQDLLARPRVVLACYCPPGAFCHRLLLAEHLIKNFGAMKGGEILWQASA